MVQLLILNNGEILIISLLALLGFLGAAYYMYTKLK